MHCPVTRPTPASPRPCCGPAFSPFPTLAKHFVPPPEDHGARAVSGMHSLLGGHGLSQSRSRWPSAAPRTARCRDGSARRQHRLEPPPPDFPPCLRAVHELPVDVGEVLLEAELRRADRRVHRHQHPGRADRRQPRLGRLPVRFGGGQVLALPRQELAPSFAAPGRLAVAGAALEPGENADGGAHACGIGRTATGSVASSLIAS